MTGLHRNIPVKYHAIDIRRDGVWESLQKSESADDREQSNTDLPKQPLAVPEVQPNQSPVLSTTDSGLNEHEQQQLCDLTDLHAEHSVEADVEVKTFGDPEQSKSVNQEVDKNDGSCSESLSPPVRSSWNDPVNFVYKRMSAEVINSFVDKPFQPDDTFQFPATNGR